MQKLKIFILFSLSQFVILNNSWAYNPDHLARALSGEQNLRGLDLSEADLRNSHFRSKDLSGTDFRRANLSSTIIYNCWLQGTIFKKAILEGATIQNCVGTGTTFKKARVIGSSFINCTFFAGCCFSHANLIEALFNGVFFGGNLFLNKANVFNCVFYRCTFQRVFYRETKNLIHASFPTQLVIEMPTAAHEEDFYPDEEEEQCCQAGEMELEDQCQPIEIEYEKEKVEDLNDICPICRELFGRKEKTFLPCAHKFCTPCITRWFTRVRMCPTCARRY